MPKYPSECTGSGGQILNFQNTLDRACDEIRMEIQTENSFQNLMSMILIISTRLNLMIDIRSQIIILH